MTIIKVGFAEDYLKRKFGKLNDDELLRLEEQTKWDVAHLNRQLAEIKYEKQRRLKGFNYDK